MFNFAYKTQPGPFNKVTTGPEEAAPRFTERDFDPCDAYWYLECPLARSQGFREEVWQGTFFHFFPLDGRPWKPHTAAGWQSECMTVEPAAEEQWGGGGGVVPGADGGSLGTTLVTVPIT